MSNVGVLDKVMAILQCFASGTERLEPPEVAARLDLSPATAYRLMKAMAEHRLIEHDPAGYRLGVTLLHLGARVANGIELRHVATPHMEWLRDQTSENAELHLRHEAARVPIEVLASVQYATPYLPWLMTGTGDDQVLTGGGLAVSIALTLVFSFINVLGVKAFARFNNVLVWWKLIIIVLVVAALVVAAFHADNFTSARTGGFAPFGYDKVFAALPAAGIVFSFLGFRQGVEFAGETSDPRRNVPFAVVGSVVITGLIYLALQAAFIGALPPSALAHGWAHLQYDNVAGPLAGLALLLGMTWLAVLLYADAIVSPADTGLIYAGVSARLSYAISRNSSAPAVLARLNQRGVPWVSVLVTFVVGCLFFLPFPSWN